jgi:hypothetical protein
MAFLSLYKTIISEDAYCPTAIPDYLNTTLQSYQVIVEDHMVLSNLWLAILNYLMRSVDHIQV